MKPELYFNEITLTFQAEGLITFPPYSGSLWHSVLGRALRDHTCIQPEETCVNCTFQQRCDYPYLFKRWAASDSLIMAGKEIPVPHIFRNDNAQSEQVKAGDDFILTLVLVGNAIEKLPTLITAFKQMGKSGLGKNRTAFQLKKISLNNTETKRIEPFITDKLELIKQASDLTIPNPLKFITVEIMTPYKPAGKRSNKQMDISHFLMAIVRRISLLHFFYCDKLLDVNFPDLKKQTTQALLVNPDLHWIHPPRPYFSKHGTQIDKSGWVGRFELQIERIEQLWPYLWLGQWLGAGKKTSMGFGKYGIINCLG